MRKRLGVSDGTDLPDVNVWLALANSHHDHHQPAKIYLESESRATIAWSRITMLGFFRLVTNPTVMDGLPMTAEQAWRAYENFNRLPGVILMPEPMGIEAVIRAWSLRRDFGRHHWTDFYLAGFAQRSGSRLVTFDRRLATFPDVDSLLLKSN